MKIDQSNDTVSVEIGSTRIDGENLILKTLMKNNCFKEGVQKVILDFNDVAYVNSLGITEIINIHRRFTETSGHQVHFKFINLHPRVLEILSLVEIQKIAEVEPRAE